MRLMRPAKAPACYLPMTCWPMTTCAPAADNPGRTPDLVGPRLPCRLSQASQQSAAGVAFRDWIKQEAAVLDWTPVRGKRMAPDVGKSSRARPE
jgi:hypothetical protein